MFPNVKPFEPNDVLPEYIWAYLPTQPNAGGSSGKWFEFSRDGFTPTNRIVGEQLKNYWHRSGYTHWFPSERNFMAPAKPVEAPKTVPLASYNELLMAHEAALERLARQQREFEPVLKKWKVSYFEMEKSYESAVKERDAARQTLNDIRNLLNNTKPKHEFDEARDGDSIV